jgi:hypothetical protein
MTKGEEYRNNIGSRAKCIASTNPDMVGVTGLIMDVHDVNDRFRYELRLDEEFKERFKFVIYYP